MRAGAEPYRVHSPGLLWRFYVTLRGFEEVLVRPAAELPRALIAHSRRDKAAASEMRAALEETWLTIAPELRERYRDVLRTVPPVVVVILTRRSPCGCLGHHHPPGVQTRLARRLKAASSAAVAEVDLAYEAIREWQPLPLSDLAADPAIGSDYRREMEGFRFRLALLDVFLHELHHYAAPHAQEKEVRGRSQRFYADALNAYTQAHFGIRYGFER